MVEVSQGERKDVVPSLHDGLGHRGLQSTQKLVSDRFSWPEVLQDVPHYGKTCESCQHMGSPRPYSTATFVPQSSSFDVFLIAFAGSLPVTAEQNKYFVWSPCRAGRERSPLVGNRPRKL